MTLCGTRTRSPELTIQPFSHNVPLAKVGIRTLHSRSALMQFRVMDSKNLLLFNTSYLSLQPLLPTLGPLG